MEHGPGPPLRSSGPSAPAESGGAAARKAAAPASPPLPAHQSARGEGALARLRAAEARLYACATHWGAALEYSLAGATSVGATFREVEAGSVLVVDLDKDRVWRANESRALLDPRMTAASREARKYNTFGLLLLGRKAVAAVAWGHASNVPGTSPVRSLAGAAALAWLAPRELLLALREDPTDRLLPALRTRYNNYYRIAQRIAREEAAAGNAKARGTFSLHLRAGAMLISGDLQRRLAAPDAAALPGCLFRRLAGRATVRATVPTLAAAKPRWDDLEGMLERAKWARLTRQTSGYPWAHQAQPEGSQVLQQIDATALVDAYIEAAGGAVDDNHVIFTIGAHAAGHTPTLEPFLAEAIDKALAAGGPLLLFDPRKLEPMPGPREAKAHWEQVLRLVGAGVYRILTEEQVKDPEQCRVVAYMSSVYKGDLPVDATDQAAIDKGDTRGISLAARARATRMVRKLEERLASWGARGGPRGSALEQLLSEEVGAFSKVRPVCRFHALARGAPLLGLPPHGVPQAGFTFPQLHDMLEGAGRASYISRLDMKDYFYQIRLSQRGSALSCVATRDPEGKLVYIALQGLSMGAPDSPLLSEMVAAVVCFIANAQGAANETSAGYSPMVDDLILIASNEHTQRAEGIMIKLLQRVKITEAVPKRVRGAKEQVLGKVFDFPSATVTLPAARLYKYMYKLHVAELCLAHADPRVRGEITPTLLSKLAGILQWLSECSTVGGSHLSVIYLVTAGGKSVASCRQGLLKELRWWRDASLAGRTESTMLLDGHGDLRVRTMATDASDVALAAVLDGRVAWRALAPHERRCSSALREVLAFLHGLETFGPAIAGARLAILSDATAGMGIFNKGRTGSEGQEIVQKCMDLLEQHRLYAFATFTPREFNPVADAASKRGTLAEVAAWARSEGLALVGPARLGGSTRERDG